MSVAAIVLAAGESRRLGQPKQLVLHNGEPLIARALRLAGEAGAAPAFAVLGAQFDIIRSAIGGGAIVVENADWGYGIATSIHAGIRALEELAADAQGALMLGCDQPRLEASHLRELIRAFDAHHGEAIVASAYAGIQGIPAIIPRTAFPGLLALRGDSGARVLIADAPCAVVAVPFEGGEIDIDFPQDLAQIG